MLFCAWQRCVEHFCANARAQREVPTFLFFSPAPDPHMLRKALAAQGLVMGAGGAALYYKWNDTGGARRSIQGSEPQAEQMLVATASVIAAARYGFCCISSPDGAPPTCRVMDLHVAKDDSLRAWLITRPGTRKAEALRRTGQCSLSFHDPRASGENGYAVLSGAVRELESTGARAQCWKPSWSFFHQGGPSGPSVVWEFTPERVEVISHAHQVAPAWQAATVVREGGEWVAVPLRHRSEHR